MPDFKVGVIILVSETASFLGVSTAGFSIQDESMDVYGTVTWEGDKAPIMPDKASMTRRRPRSAHG